MAMEDVAITGMGLVSPIGQDLGDDLVDAHRLGHGAGGPLVVAGEQHRGEPERAELADRGALRHQLAIGAVPPSGHAIGYHGRPVVAAATPSTAAGPSTKDASSAAPS